MIRENVRLIQKMTVFACENYHRLCCEYVKENYPRGYGYWMAEKDGYAFKDLEIYRAMVEYQTLCKVLKLFRVEPETSDLADQYLREEIEWLSNGVEEVWGKVWGVDRR